MRFVSRFSMLLLVVSAVLAISMPAVAAPSADEVASTVAALGFFVEEGSDLSDDDAGDLVAQARNQGEKLSIVVLTSDPGTGAVAFGDAVVDRLVDPGLIFVLTPDDLGATGEATVYTDAEIATALDAAADAGGSDTAVVTAFVGTLTGGPVPEPELVTSSGGGSGGLFIFLLLIVAIGLVLFWLVRRSKKQQQATIEAQLAEARGEIQTQLDGIANDLLDLEDEVRVADNDRVDELYNAAGDTYRDASDRLEDARSAAGLLDISNELDVAIWQLDSAEALLDGKQPPPKPRPKRLEPEPVPADSAAEDGPLGLPPRPSYRDGGYQRRPSRRAGGLSPNLIQILIGLGAASMAGRRSPTRSGRTSPSRRQPPPPSPPSRSGGEFLPSPSRPGTPPPDQPADRSPKGTGRRIRMGRKRRR